LASLSLVAACGGIDATDESQEQARHALSLVQERQAAYLSEHGRYASDAAELFLTDALPVGVSVRISSASEDGYSAVATHTSLPGTPCTIYAGEPPTFSAVPTPGGAAAATVG